MMGMDFEVPDERKTLNPLDVGIVHDSLRQHIVTTIDLSSLTRMEGIAIAAQILIDLTNGD